MTEFTDEHTDLLNAIYKLAHQIDQTKDLAKIAEYVDQLSVLKARLMALGHGPVKKAAGQP